MKLSAFGKPTTPTPVDDQIKIIKNYKPQQDGLRVQRPLSNDSQIRVSSKSRESGTFKEILKARTPLDAFSGSEGSPDARIATSSGEETYDENLRDSLLDQQLQNRGLAANNRLALEVKSHIDSIAELN